MERIIKGIPAREMPEASLFDLGQLPATFTESPLFCLDKRVGVHEERRRGKRHA